MSYLLHSEVYMPKRFSSISVKLMKKYTLLKTSHHVSNYLNNAEEVREDDERRKYIDYKHDFISSELVSALKYIIKHNVKPFEVEITREKNKNFVTKYVFRGYVASRNQDLVISLRPKKEDKLNFVVTAWWNKKEDIHSTLNKSKYLNESQSHYLLGE